MARALHKLTDVAVRRADKRGKHSDGGGLYLNVAAGGTRSWVFMWTPPGGKRREAGLGSYPAVSLANARRIAVTMREAVAEGRDPIADRKRTSEPTFEDAAERFIAANEGSWSNPKHVAQWRSTLATYGAPIAKMRVSAVDAGAVLRCLTPIWQSKPETASRVRGRIERVLDYARVQGWREGENPARWRGGLQAALPTPARLTRGHHAAMPYRDVPAFMEQLAARPAISALALRFAILTAARSGEVLRARWSEIDLDDALWTIPAERMKARRQHRVPLSVEAVELLRPLAESPVGAFVFPGTKHDPDKRGPLPLSNMAMALLLRRMDRADITPHGFRSAFRDWAGDETSFPREVAEAALAHAVGDATERAYRRSDALEKRRRLMDAWGAFAIGKRAGKVVALRRAN